MGLNRWITARALTPRRDHISVRSLSRIRLTAALLGRISSLLWYRRTLNPRKSKALLEGDDPRLILVEDQSPGRQPAGKPRLDLLGLVPGMAQGD